jgi:hypothetical protein
MTEVTIPEMVRNGTMNAEMAAVIWAAVDEGVSFLTAAIPRFAGKTTTSNAALALRRPEVPLHWVDGRPAHMEKLLQQRTGGYLAVEEFDRAPMTGYIWGEPVRRVFQTVAEGGYSLQGVLHAHSVDEAVRLISEGNGVSDEHAGIFKLILYIERFGTGYNSFWRRITNLYEMHRVEGGSPVGHPLFTWDPQQDHFQKHMDPHQWAHDREDLGRRTELMSQLASEGRTSSSEVASALAEFR